MAFPVILVDSATGSDTAASGAGPSTAKTGSAGVSAADGLSVILDGSPDLSGVATDGSHVLFYNDTTAGNRNFAPITGTANSGTPTATVTLGNAVGTVLNKAWAIGGKRASITGTLSKKLFDNNSAAGDAMPGWTVAMADGHVEVWTGTASLAFRRAGDATSGLITLRGTPGAVTRVVVNGPNGNVTALNVIAANIRLANFDLLAHTSTTKSNSALLGIASSLGADSHRIIEDVRIGGTGTSTGFYQGIAGNVSGCMQLRDVEIGWCYDAGIASAANSSVVLENVWVHDCDHGAGNGYGINSSSNFSMRRVYVTNCRGDGIRVSLVGSAGLGLGSGDLIDCVCHGNGGDGVEIGGASTQIDGYRALRIVNGSFTGNGGYGLNFAGASVTAIYLALHGSRILNCNFGTGGTANTSGKSNLTHEATVEIGSQQVDPGFTDSTNATRSLRNYSVGTSLKALGWPTDNLPGNATRSYVDIGGTQRQEPAGGGGQRVYGG